MKKFILFILLSTGCFMLFGCAAVAKDYCTVNAAYTAGVNDGQDNQPMQNYAVVFCPKPQQAKLNAAYDRGYKYGTKHRRHHRRPPPPRPHPHHHRYY